MGRFPCPNVFLTAPYRLTAKLIDVDGLGDPVINLPMRDIYLESVLGCFLTENLDRLTKTTPPMNRKR